MLDASGISGLHTSLSGFVTNDKCPCGRQGPRLMDIRPVPRAETEEQRWAATA
jgi:hypothetical protein